MKLDSLIEKCLEKFIIFIFAMLRAFITLLLATLLVFAAIAISRKTCEAKTIYYGSEVEPIPIVYGGPTIFRFNEEVKTISQASRFKIEPIDLKDPNYAVLSITPRFTKGTSRVSFILANGAVVNTKIKIYAKQKLSSSDSIYDFEPKEALINNSSNTKGKNVTDMALIKAMIRSDNVVGYKARSLRRWVRSGVKGVDAVLVKIYVGPKFTGYVYKLTNKLNKPFKIDLKSLSFGRPNLAVLSQVDKKVLVDKKQSTLLRVVTKPTSVYYNINLPVAPVSKDKS